MKGEKGYGLPFHAWLAGHVAPESTKAHHSLGAWGACQGQQALGKWVKLGENAEMTYPQCGRSIKTYARGNNAAPSITKYRSLVQPYAQIVALRAHGAKCAPTNTLQLTQPMGEVVVSPIDNNIDHLLMKGKKRGTLVSSSKWGNKIFRHLRRPPTSPYWPILYYTILYYTILYYTILYYTILYYTILYYTILYYTILYYTILYYTILYYTILYYTILYYTILYYTILYYTIPYHTILYYTILYYTILYYTI